MTRSEIGLAWPTDKPPGRYGELAARAEDLGFDVVSVFADLLDQPPLPALLEMARATSRVRLGVACLNPYTGPVFRLAPGFAGRVRELVAAGQDGLTDAGGVELLGREVLPLLRR